MKRYGEILEFCKPEIIMIPTSEISQIKLIKPHNEGPIINNTTGLQFKIATLNNIRINITNISDCYIGFEKNGKLNICKFFNICKNCMAENDVVFIIKIFNKIEPYFEKPLNSIKLGIAIVDKLSNNFLQVDINKTKFKKYMLLNINQNSQYIALPVMHTN